MCLYVLSELLAESIKLNLGFLLIDAFRPLMFKVTIDRVELIFITCFTIFFCSHPCSLFLFLSLLFFYLLWFLTISYDSSFTPYLLPYQLCFFFTFFQWLSYSLQYTFMANPSPLSSNTIPLHINVHIL